MSASLDEHLFLLLSVHAVLHCHMDAAVSCLAVPCTALSYCMLVAAGCTHAPQLKLPFCGTCDGSGGRSK